MTPTIPYGEESPQHRGILILAAALGFGLFVHALLPEWTAVLNDDFAYLRSVIETLRR